MPRNIIIKFVDTKGKRRTLESIHREMIHCLQSTKSPDFSPEVMEAREVAQRFSGAKRRIPYPGRKSIRNEREMKTFSKEGKQRFCC